MKTYILHHNDADGFGAAYSAYMKFGKENVEYIPIDYGWQFPVLEDGSDVYILDFSISRSELDSLVARMNFVLILDHHKSAAEKLEGHPNTFFDMKRSGAGIAWDYFNPNVPRPDFITYIEDQDLFNMAFHNSHEVRSSILIIPLTLDAYIEAAKVSIEEREYEGTIIQKQVQYNIERGLEYIHVIEVDEYKMLAVNVCVHQSNYGVELRKHLAKYGCDFSGVYYRVNQNFVKFSCRSNADFDMSLLCKRFGGGGHKQAAGFDVPVEKFNGVFVKSKEI